MPVFIVLVGGLEEEINRGNLRAATNAVMNNMQVDVAQGTHALITDDQGASFEVVIERGKHNDPWIEAPVVKTPRGPIVPDVPQQLGRSKVAESGIVERPGAAVPKVAREKD